MELTLTFTFLVGIVSGFIGVNVGGGGLIAIPALIFLGLPPHIAIATNKVGSLGMVTSGLYRFHKGGKVNYKIGIPIAILSLIGAYIGANTLLKVPADILEKFVGIFIVVILVIILLNKKLGIEKSEQPSRVSQYFGYVSFILIGFWGAFFGGGWAIFATYSLLFFFGQTFLESAGVKKLAGIGIALVAIIVFAINQIINWVIGITLLIGMALGAYLGASYGLKKGDKWVRSLFIVIVLISALKLFL